MITRTIQLLPSGPDATDGATLVSRADPSGADRSDGVQPPTDLAVGIDSLVARNLEVYGPTSGRRPIMRPLAYRHRADRPFVGCLRRGGVQPARRPVLRAATDGREVRDLWPAAQNEQRTRLAHPRGAHAA